MPVNIDIIILSYSKNEDLKRITQESIISLLSSEDPASVIFHPIVVESERSLQPFQFDGARTLYPTNEFGYNKFLNLGISESYNPYICLCNNDLVFHKGWASRILKEMDKDEQLKSASPYCDFYHANNGITTERNIVSTTNGVLIGWCIFLKRELLNTIGLFDEELKFWYADNDYGNTLQKHQIKHMLIVDSKVTHLGSKTHNTLNEKDLFDYTYGQFIYYDFKWHHKSKINYMFQKIGLPLFRFVYMRRLNHPIFNFFTKGVAKLYGGLKH